MRATTLPHALLALASLASAAVNVTETNTVDLIAGKGDLGWGASGLAFGYSAGSGLNFDTGVFVCCVMPPLFFRAGQKRSFLG